MTRLRLSVALVVLVLLGTPWADAAAQEYGYSPAELAEIRQRAERGDAHAQWQFGSSFEQCYGQRKLSGGFASRRAQITPC